MSKKNLWIFTEEYPKIEVVKGIFEIFAKDFNVCFLSGHIRIIPLLEMNSNNFSFTYEVLGVNANKVGRIFIKIVSGNTSFVDYLIFFESNQPSASSEPIYAIEETKTDDSESRNTGVYQRCSKFVYIESIYPKAKKIMYYSLKILQKENPTQTNIFGSKLLATYGVAVVGKIQTNDQETPFESIDELIEFKRSMRKPPKGNVPIDIVMESDNKITVSGRLIKSGSLSHDPNIGALSIICAVLRKLGWKGKIVIVKHGLDQSHIRANNKFIRIANKFEIDISDELSLNKTLKIPSSNEEIDYWKLEVSGEKIASIFIHLVVENFTNGFSAFHNHAGCEKSYFYDAAEDTYTALSKYKDTEAYKAGDKTQIIHIPDLILIDTKREEVINVEAKKYSTRIQGIQELNNFDAVEERYIRKSYKGYVILRTVVIFGSKENKILEAEISLMINELGGIYLNINAPDIFKEGVDNLIKYWS